MLTDTLSPLVFSDIDGTLLSRENGGFDPARELLQQLEHLKVPVILATSRTIDQTLPLRRKMGNTHPFVVENGAGICVPEGYFPEPLGEPAGNNLRVQALGMARDEIARRLAELKGEFDFRILSETGDEEILQQTELSADELAAARERIGSEWILWPGDQDSLSRFLRRVERSGLLAVQSGRFLHVTGETDKARAMAVLRADYQRHVSGHRFTAIALGDGPNDLEMLRTADIGVVLPRADGSYVAPETAPHLRHASQPGPAGWSETMFEIMEELAAA